MEKKNLTYFVIPVAAGLIWLGATQLIVVYMRGQIEEIATAAAAQAVTKALEQLPVPAADAASSMDTLTVTAK